MLVVAYTPFFFIITLEDGAEVTTIDRYMRLIVLIWIIIILYEHDSDDIL